MPATKVAHRHCVYRFYGPSGELLYIGRSARVYDRMREHGDKSWWPEATRVEIERYATQAEAIAQEAEAISELRPLHNTRGAPLAATAAEALAAALDRKAEKDAARESLAASNAALGEAAAAANAAGVPITVLARELGLSRQGVYDLVRAASR